MVLLLFQFGQQNNAVPATVSDPDQVPPAVRDAETQVQLSVPYLVHSMDCLWVSVRVFHLCSEPLYLASERSCEFLVPLSDLGSVSAGTSEALAHLFLKDLFYFSVPGMCVYVHVSSYV